MGCRKAGTYQKLPKYAPTQYRFRLGGADDKIERFYEETIAQSKAGSR